MVVDGELAAIFYAADTIRSDSRQLIAELHRRGIQTHMLTGDIAPVAHAIAESLGLKPEEVHAEALPDEKAEFVKGLSAKGHRVAFVGDGINDSAALAYADVSISFASGSDLARETADIVLINDKVSDLLVAQDIAKRTFSIVRENIGIVGVPNLSALVLGTFLPISPIAAVMINNGSAIVAAANALKVLGFNQKKLPDSPSVSQSLTHQSTKEHQTSGASVGDSKTAVASEPADSNNINLLQLSSRLRLKHQSITARRNRPDFSEWSAQHDPDGLAWTYRSKTKSYGRS
jgi:soluble P-type ATPase